MLIDEASADAARLLRRSEVGSWSSGRENERTAETWTDRQTAWWNCFRTPGMYRLFEEDAL